MRLLIDSLIAVMLIGILAAVLLHHRHAQQQVEQYRQVHQALAALREQALYQAALREAASEEQTYPQEIDRAWFGAHLPINTVAPADHPWMDVAPEGDTHDHPPDPVLISKEQAGFWYNPALGVFRARVPQQVTAQETLTLYNRVNGTALLSLPVSDDPARQPQRPAWGAIRARPAVKLSLGEGVVEVARPVESTPPEPAPEAAPKPRPRRSLLDEVAGD